MTVRELVCLSHHQQNSPFRSDTWQQGKACLLRHHQSVTLCIANEGAHSHHACDSMGTSAFPTINKEVHTHQTTSAASNCSPHWFLTPSIWGSEGHPELDKISWVQPFSCTEIHVHSVLLCHPNSCTVTSGVWCGCHINHKRNKRFCFKLQSSCDIIKESTM